MRNEHALSLAVALGLAVLLPARTALAYCRTTSCGDAGTGQACTPPNPSDCGTPLFWKSPCVGYSIQEKASTKVTFAETERALKAAFATWEAADCGGGSPHIVATEAQAAECTKHEYNQDRGNQNLIVFRDDKWPYEGSSNTLALTTVTYNLETGEIYDADMELNSADNPLTTGDTGVEFDFQSIVTHETGHFLGLAHSSEIDATMFPDYKEGDTGLRTLSPDDVAAICAVYPPGAPIPASCDITPRHGFSTLCGADQPPVAAGGCSCNVAMPDAPSWVGIAAAVGALALVSRRRTARGGARCDQRIR